MKKLALISILFSGGFALSACSSPPEPVGFPHGATGDNANTFIYQKEGNKVPLNQFDSPKWSYSIINQGATLSQANVAKFWYFAQHADKITLSGEPKNIENLRLSLVAQGATKNMQLVPNCYSTKAKPCPKSVTIILEKDNTKNVTTDKTKGADL